MAKPTDDQQAKRDEENAKTLVYLAKQGNQKAKDAITRDGGKAA